MNNKNKHIILFDGVCNLCNSSVRFILRKDKKNKFKFASLQSDATKNILLHKIPEKKLTTELNTIFLVENNSISSKSTAILSILKQLPFPYNLSYVFIIFPKFIRDFVYKYISKNRYKWFGKQETCMVPTKELKNKFLS